MRITRLILAGLLLVTLLVLVLQNLGLVGLRFINWELALPIALPVAVAYVLGAWTGGILFDFLRREGRELRHEQHSSAGASARK